jgi:Protein of unknown function (DUF1236)
MKTRMALPIALASVFVCSAVLERSFAQGITGGASSAGEQHRLVLTPSQRRAIYAAVTKDMSKTARTQFPATVGAEVPPMIELYSLPDEVLAENREANFYEYTMVQDKVVLVDPTKMRVIDVIGPPTQ